MDRILLRIRRLTYWQCSLAGLALILGLVAWEGWKLYRRTMAIQNLAGRVSLRAEALGPGWLRSNVPDWVSDNVLVTPQAAYLTSHAAEAEVPLNDLGQLKSLRSLNVYSFGSNAKANWHGHIRIIGRIPGSTN